MKTNKVIFIVLIVAIIGLSIYCTLKPSKSDNYMHTGDSGMGTEFIPQDPVMNADVQPFDSMQLVEPGEEMAFGTGQGLWGQMRYVSEQ